MGVATLIRKGTAVIWEFKDDPEYGSLVYRTGRNIYKVMEGLDFSTPFWVGKLVITKGEESWVTVETELRAERLDFDSGGVYLFPDR